MIFDKKTGKLEILPNLVLYPKMKRNDLLTQGIKFENWGGTSEDGLTYSYKTVLNDEEFSSVEGLIVIVYFGVDAIKSWDVGPSSTLFEGHQSGPEGKYTRRLRKWFKEKTTVGLPVGGDWGNIDASYDHWNLTSSIVCNYREGFKSEESWKEYRKDNKF